jgi:hypothetical protein
VITVVARCSGEALTSWTAQRERDKLKQFDDPAAPAAAEQPPPPSRAPPKRGGGRKAKALARVVRHDQLKVYPATAKWAQLYPKGLLRENDEDFARPPSAAEVEAYAGVALGLALPAERELLYLAEAALAAPLPRGWGQGEDGEGTVLFYVLASGGEVRGSAPRALWRVDGVEPQDQRHPAPQDGAHRSGGADPRGVLQHRDCAAVQVWQYEHPLLGHFKELVEKNRGLLAARAKQGATGSASGGGGAEAGPLLLEH